MLERLLRAQRTIIVEWVDLMSGHIVRPVPDQFIRARYMQLL